ncbi:MAG: hypothetical protein Q7T49_00285 [bacterium]|nr:hypothetical protein [bacterium]
MWIVERLMNLPNVLIQQYPVTLVVIGVIMTVMVFSYLIQNMRLKKRQNLVDHALDEIADRKKTSSGLFLNYMFSFGIIGEQERLVLAGKYGPGIASDISLAKLVARLMLEHCYSSERLARGIVEHFMMGNGAKFITREAYLLIFLKQVLNCFSMEVDEEITDRSLLDDAVRRQLATHKRQEKLHLGYLEQVKANKARGKRFGAVDTAFGLNKPWWQCWGEVLDLQLRAVGRLATNKLKTIPMKSLF